MIGPAEIEDILLDLSEALACPKTAPLERMPVWPVPARMLLDAHAHTDGRSGAASATHAPAWPRDRSTCPDAAA